MKKVLAVWVLILLVGVVCSAVKIEFWMVGWSNEMANVAKSIIDTEFTPQTGIEVTIVPLAWGDYYQKSLLAIASRDTPDIFSLGSEIADFALRGGLIDLAAFKPEEYAELEKGIFTSVMGPFSFKTARFALPIDVSGYIAVYRTDLLADLGMGIPETWDDIRSWQPKVLANGMTLAYTNFEDMWGAYTHITQNGGQFFGSDGFSSALDREESVEGFVNYIELFTVHQLPKVLVGPEPFIRGEQLSYADGLWVYGTLSQSAPTIQGKWQVGLIPGTRKDGKVNHGSFAGSTLLGISAFSNKKEEAWEFLKWFLSADVLQRIANGIMASSNGWIWLPANKEAMSNVNLLVDVRDIYYRQIDESYPVPYAVNALVQYRFVTLAIQKCVTQGADPREEILKAAEDMNEEMARRKREYSRFLESLQIGG
ncbi:MAG TPA: extracellular solute-binding protein [Bacillota bacterium]|nr:extracellular solute-binding protein [Bacillota bacterium]